MPEIAFLMGKSSSGKDNIFKALVGDKELNLKTVIMYTTRPMRAGEKEGVEYYYVDNEKALELEAADKVIEMRIYNTVYGEWKDFTVDEYMIYDGKIHGASCVLLICSLLDEDIIRNYIKAVTSSGKCLLMN